MRTTFVNPSRRRRRRTSRKRTRRNTSPKKVNTMARRRRTISKNAHRRPTARRRISRRRRRNASSGPGAAVTSFTRQNPLILSNPRRRRRRRNPAMNMKTMLNETATFAGGGALGYAVNQFGLSNIENDWARRAAQVAVAVGGAMFLKGKLGAAFAGSAMYPLMADLAMASGVTGEPTEADLLELSADLEDALAEGGYGPVLDEGEISIEDYSPVEPEMAEW